MGEGYGRLEQGAPQTDIGGGLAARPPYPFFASPAFIRESVPVSWLNVFKTSR